MRCTHLKQVGIASLVFLLAAGAAVAGAQVRATSTSLQLAASGSKVTATVHVAGSGTPSGVVTVVATSHAQSRELGSVTLDAAGNGSLLLDANTATGQLAAYYAGDAANGSSTSTEGQLQPLNSAAADYTFALSLTSLPVSAGSTGTTVATVTPVNGFSQNVTFYCTGLPLNSQCVFTPSTVQPVSGAVTSTLQILTTSTSGYLSPSGKHSRVATQSTSLFFAVVLALGLLLVSRGRGLQKLRVPTLMLLGGVLLLGLSGCSARYSYYNNHPETGTGTPTGTYNVTVSASSDNGITTIVHTVPLVLTVD